MPVLDRYLEAMSKQRAEALVFRSGAPVEMVSGGVARPVSSKPASAEQIRGLFAEALGDTSDGFHTYRSPLGLVVSVALQSAPGGGLTARIEPAPPEEAPLELASAPARAAAQPVASAGASLGPPRTMDELFHQMLDLKASDLHLKSDKVPQVRVDGSIGPLPGRPPLDSEMLHRFVHSIMPERNQLEFKDTSDTDFAYELMEEPALPATGGARKGGALVTRARMRCNVFRDIAGAGAVFRQIPSKILTAKDLNLPKAVLDFCTYDKGLVVVTGPTGSGKSTTLAAMIDHINETRDDHLITIEDPVEFVHPDKKCLINQREVGTHTRGFKNALRAALREDPDIVLVGEMRDLETVSIAIETAETGHLVFGTLHTNTAASTVDRLIDQFPADRQSQVRTMLSESLKGVVAQTLLKRKGGGRVAALEILVVTSAIANLIREGKTFQIPSAMQVGKGLGMQTLSDSMIELVKGGVVEPQEAYDRSIAKKEFGLLLTRSGFKGPWSDEKAA